MMGRARGALLSGLALLVSTGACGGEAFAPAPGSPYRTASRPNSVVSDDFNGDGRSDLLVACSGSDSVSLLAGDRRGGFGARHSFPAMPGVHMLAIGDWNGDGKPDVAVSAHDANEIVLLRNDGRGGFVQLPPVTVFGEGKPHNHGLAAGDVNEDGHGDLTVGHQELGSIAVLLGDGKDGFRPAPDSPVPVGRAPYPHTLADVNGDRHLDLVVPDVQGNRVRLFAGDGKGRFRPLPEVSTGIERPFFVVAQDVNGDRAIDLIVTHDDTHRVAALLGDGRGGFRHSPSSPFEGRGASWKCGVADLNGDGKMDLALAGGGSIRIFDGDGRGGFRFQSNLSTRGESWEVIVKDVNGDKRADVVAPSGAAGVVHVFLAP
ncbi:MAG TPA: VCBS repeat-containing protein [Candidatus Eisenbacteria bacterium]|nr:VCBS repeat-containing protein [Candidatus Eisenbacteria bacterium]